MIPPEFIQTLLDRVDIVDLIGQSVALKKAGANHVARCPFHQEKTPSFSVSSQRQFYHCFGCGASGNAISFVIQYHGASFVDAVNLLAAQAGLTVPSQASAPPPSVSPSPSQLDLLAQVSNYYHQQLWHHPRAQDYLARRGVLDDAAKTFQLGYAPPGWHGLTTAFPHVATSLWLDIGLWVTQDKGGHHDRFRDRLMFPIQDTRGRVIAFGGRVLDQGEPKYLNSPETQLFAKGQELYGWPQARQALRQHNEVLVVEGYMDVVSLAQAGIGHVVASLGTAISEFQIKRLLRSAERLVFAFDGDKAGRKAAERAMERVLPLFEEGKDVAFLFFPDGEDPDSFVRTQGAPALRDKIAQALPLSSFILEHVSDGLARHHPESQGQFLRRAQLILSSIRSAWLTYALKKRMASWLEIDSAQLDAFLDLSPSPSPAPRAVRPSRTRHPPPTLARQLLACLMVCPELVHEVGLPQEDPGAHLPDEKAVPQVASFLRHEDPPPSLALLLEHFRSQPEEAVVNSVLQKEFIPLCDTPKNELVPVYRDGLQRWTLLVRQREIDQLLSQAKNQPLEREALERLQTLLMTRPS